MNTNYDAMDDNELIIRQREGDTKVTEYLMDKYKDLVRKKAGSMYILGADREDLIQEGMIGLFKALRDYDMGRDAAFNTFASLCISRQMYTAVEAARRKKHAPLNSYISLYDDGGSTGNFGDYKGNEGGSDREGDIPDRGVMNTLVSLSELNPEDILIDRENVRDLWETIDRILSPLERKVLDLLLTGMDYTEIARVLGRDSKSTDNAIQRIKNKLKKNL